MGRSALLLLAGLPAVAGQGNGYVAQFSTRAQIMGTKNSMLDTSNSEIAKMSAGFTIMLWAKFPDLSSIFQPSAQIMLKTDGNFMQPFGGTHGGFEFTSNAQSTVSTLGDAARNWHNYAVSWDAATGEVKHYIDGALISTKTKTNYDTTWLTKQAFLIFGQSCYPPNYDSGTSYTSCNTGFQFEGEMDDVAIFAGALTGAEIAARWDQSLTNRVVAGLEPNLIFFYNFNDPLTVAGEIPNLGTAGSGWDLTLGKLPKPVGGTLLSTGYTFGGVDYTFTQPRIVPCCSGVMPGKVLDTNAPVVTTAAAGETISQTMYGTTISYTAPSTFTSTAVTSGSGGRGWHVVPKANPSAMASAFLTSTLLEDASTAVRLSGDSTCGGTLIAKVTTLPTKGNLYYIKNSGDTSTATPVTANMLLDQNSSYVLYVPNANEFGKPHDTFQYAVTLAEYTGFESSAATITLNVEGDDDLPATSAVTKAFVEDTVPQGVVVPLTATDAETGTPLNVVISTLPTQGKLFTSVDGGLTSNRTEITSVYNVFQVGTVIPQYLDTVTAVSSFWGGPPYAGYHPLTILGKPDCKAYGECPQDSAWVTDTSVYPEIGERCLHKTLVAFVKSYDAAAATVTLQYHKMFLADGTQCVIDPDGATKSYPADCTTTLVPSDSSMYEKTVPRSELGGMDAGGWCPLNMGYIGDSTMTGGGAFGSQYAFNHNQKGPWASTPVYTEYIEVTVATPVYVVFIEVGSPRGMGHITSIKVKNPSGSWISLYGGAALTEVASEYATRKKYWEWAPDACRTHFLTSELRIEIDSSSESGIADWNYIDYVKVYGSTSLQAAALPKGTTSVIYVPDEHASGTDTFGYTATDCPGNLFRSSAEATVTLNIAPVNDVPYAGETAHAMLTGEVGPVLLAFGDVDEDNANLTVKITSLPDKGVRVNVGEGVPAAFGTELTSSMLPYTTPTGVDRYVRVFAGGESGNATMGFTVTDKHGNTTSGSLTLVISAEPSDSTGVLIAIVAALGGVLMLVGCFGGYRAVKFILAAIKAKELIEQEEIARCRRAVNAARTIESTFHIINLKNFKALGTITSHEDAREKGMLVHVDNYEDLIVFVQHHPVAFISHQWLAWSDPDPDKLQYGNMVSSLEILCKENGYMEENLHIFLDYTSIPQKNVTARVNAINSLGVFSSLAQHFLIIAPTSKHKDTSLVCDKATYGRRGWCRLEQWGHMCMWGMQEMFFYDMEKGQNVPLTDDGNWKFDSIMVFEGDYTNPDNKKEIVDVILGLYAMVLQSRDGMTKELFELLETHESRVFPKEYFVGLPQRLRHLFETDRELRDVLAEAASKVAAGSEGRRESKQMKSLEA